MKRFSKVAAVKGAAREHIGQLPRHQVIPDKRYRKPKHRNKQQEEQ